MIKPLLRCYRAMLNTFFVFAYMPVFAQPDEPSFIIAGPALVPEYQGSDDYISVPMIVSQFNVNGVDVDIEGLTFRASLYNHNNWRFGLASELDTGRDYSVENTTISTFEQIDLALNLGSFAEYQHGDSLFDGDSLSYRLSMFTDGSGVYDGYYATAELSYAFPVVIPWLVELELTSTYADENYMNTYFGVGRLDALNSGLPEYTVGSSVRDVTLNVNIGLFVSPQWGAFMRLGTTQLIGDAKDSPITWSGSNSQHFIGLGVFYRLGG